MVPTGQTADEYEKESAKEMDDSQKDAIKAAKRLLKSKGIDVSSVQATMHVDDIGGPSAGMMYALGLIDKLTPQDETGGKVIAGTGTIDAKGKVGEIGGIRLKMLGAKRDGAAWFLAPKGNCDDVVGHVPEGLRDVAVSTLDEAYDALVAIGEGKGRRCLIAPLKRQTRVRSENMGSYPRISPHVAILRFCESNGIAER